MWSWCSFVICLLILSANGALGAREFGGCYSEQRITNLRRNCERFDWVREEREKAVSAAKPWLAISDDDLWKMVPGQDLPRCIDVTLDRLTTGPTRLGCLKCGDKIFGHGNYPYNPDFKKQPFKLVCPSCSVVFPTNDFGKYYESGIDERGVFNPARADRSLLFNTDHPDSGDPLRSYGVDDGLGYIDADGRAHKFIGYYTWKYWMHVYGGLSALANAYLYTGDKTYARKAAILLDRIADVYPSMDWKPYADRGWFHSDGGAGTGKIEGRIWECFVATQFADAYDKIISGTDDNPELYACLQRQASRFNLPRPKGTRELFVQNVDDGVLRCVVAGIHSGQIKGNEGMHQRAMTMCAIALDTEPETTQWLDWLFDPRGGAIPGLIVGSFDRDGVSPEGAPGYALSWGINFNTVAKRLAAYGKYKRHDLYRDFPQFRASFTAASRMCALGRATPNIGDTGVTGKVGSVSVNLEFMADGYRFTRDPEIAVAAWRANGNSARGLGRDVFAAQPDELSREIEAVGNKAGPRPLGGYNMSGFGLAILECGAGASATALCCNYGRTMMHAHLDALNFDLLACGAWLAPDHGYPEFATAWPSRTEWTHNTISHNTVVIDGHPQESAWGGHTRLFKQLPGFGVFELDCRAAYPGMQEYARAMFLVEAPGGNSYAVDIFRAVGGKDHLLSFHGPPGEITSAGLTLEDQGSGTYAGKNVAFQAKPDGFPMGYSWLYSVKRQTAPPPEFQLDWKAEVAYRGLKQNDNVHLRMHAFSGCNDVAIADGDPPQNKPGNPRRLGYVLMHRTGDTTLASTFLLVLEPYRDKPFIRSVRQLDAGTSGSNAARAGLRIEQANGMVDYLLWNLSGGKVDFAGDISLDGKAGFVRVVGEKVTSAVLVQGSALACKGAELKGMPAFKGKVVKMNRELDGGGWLWVDTELPDDGSLTGEQIMVDPASERDACYTIREVKRDGRLTKVFCGPISFVRGYHGEPAKLRGQPVARDYTKGYVYDFEVGAGFSIPLHVSR